MKINNFIRMGKSIFHLFTRPIDIIRDYDTNSVRPDLIAGLTVSVILLPQAMAYALIAELPPQMGLYTAIIASIVGALWGSSYHLQTGPTNAASLLVLSILITVAPAGSNTYLLTAGLLAILVGIIRILLGIFHLGMLVNFVSDSVVIGFAAGAGVLIFFNQLRHLLRIDIASQPSLLDMFVNIRNNIASLHLTSLLIGLSVIIIILLLKKFIPKLPGPLSAIVLSALMVMLFNLDEVGVEVIGEIPKGIPPMINIRSLDFQFFREISTGALAIAAIGLVEAMSAARSVAGKSGQRLNSNQEFFGQGLANIFSGLFSGYTCSGSFTRTAINYQSGGRTSLSNVYSGLFVLVVIIIFGSFAAYIPLPALAGVVLIVALQLVDLKEMLRIWQSGRGDRVIMVVTFLSTLILPLSIAVLSGIVISLAYYLLETSTPQVRTVVPDRNFEYFIHEPSIPNCPQLGIVEIFGDMYFGAVHHVEEEIISNRKLNPSQRFLLLRMTGVAHCDISGIHALEGITRAYREIGGDIFISRYRHPVMDIMHDTGFYETLGEKNYFNRDQNAIDYLYHKVLDPAICIYECPHRVFLECQNLPKRLDLSGDHLYTDIPGKSIEYISPMELWRAMHEEAPLTIVDVREPREFEQGYIPGAISIPLPLLLEKPELILDKENVVLVCRGGRRSSRAAVVLEESNGRSYSVLEGGVLHWEATNLFEAYL